MGFIYKITNQINNKVYIGQTITTIKQRMYKHYSNAKKANTGIDYAIYKYGKENFLVEQICECPDEKLDELEKYYIKYYDTYNNGYNLTYGGQDGSGNTLRLNEDQLIQDYLSGKSIKDLTIPYNCCERTISNILYKHHIKIRRNFNLNLDNLKKGKKFKEGDNVKAVYIKELDKTFPSLKECSQWLIDNGYSKAKDMNTARKSLSRVLTGERKTYCGMHFIYA